MHAAGNGHLLHLLPAVGRLGSCYSEVSKPRTEVSEAEINYFLACQALAMDDDSDDDYWP